MSYQIGMKIHQIEGSVLKLLDVKYELFDKVMEKLVQNILKYTQILIKFQIIPIKNQKPYEKGHQKIAILQYLGTYFENLLCSI